MFMEIVTVRKEVVNININQIVYITPEKTRAVIVDSTGQDYFVDEPYESVMNRIKALTGQNSWQNV